MGAAGHHRRVEEVLADLAPQRGLKGRQGGKWRGQPVCAVWNGGGVEGGHDVHYLSKRESSKSARQSLDACSGSLEFVQVSFGGTLAGEVIMPRPHLEGSR